MRWQSPHTNNLGAGGWFDDVYHVEKCVRQSKKDNPGFNHWIEQREFLVEEQAGK